MALMGFYTLRNDDTEQEYTIEADDFVWDDASESGEQYRFVHRESELLPEVVVTFDIDSEECNVQIPESYEEVESGLYLNVMLDDYDAESEYGYDHGYDD